MNRDDAYALLARVLREIAPEVDLSTVDWHVSLQEELDLDSMDFLNVMTAVHDETGIEVPERDYAKVSSIEGFVDYVVAAAATSAGTSAAAGRT